MAINLDLTAPMAINLDLTTLSLDLNFGLPGPAGPIGGGDTYSAISSSVDSEVAIFSGTTGKLIKNATHTGLLKAAAGVIATATVDSDYLSPSSHIDGGTFD